MCILGILLSACAYSAFQTIVNSFSVVRYLVIFVMRCERVHLQHSISKIYFMSVGTSLRSRDMCRHIDEEWQYKEWNAHAHINVNVTACLLTDLLSRIPMVWQLRSDQVRDRGHGSGTLHPREDHASTGTASSRLKVWVDERELTLGIPELGL